MIKNSIKYNNPKKRFGQNFLIDKQIISQIIGTIAPQENDNMLEIGIGLGAITLPLLAKLKLLNIVEIDRDLISYWQAKKIENLIINQSDILKFDLNTLGKNLRIVGNLPYNISTPILFKMIKSRSNIIDMTFMLQKEVVQRIVAKPNNKTYGRSSVMLQAFFEVTMCFTVNAQAFEPAPKVESAIIYLKPIISKVSNIEGFSTIVKAAFSTRRKTLNNCLKNFINQKNTNINLKLRAENLSVDDFITLSKDYGKLCNR